jgi:hypothetical protein
MTQLIDQRDVTPYGVLRCIRYLVNSTPEFIEVLHTVNGIIGTIHSTQDVEMIQQSALFSFIPLPHSQTKFIACFDVPSDLLGAMASRRPLYLDFTGYDQKKRPEPIIVRKNPQVLFCFSVKTLFDINFALYQFESTLAPAIPQAQWLRVRRSMSVMVSAGETTNNVTQLIIAADANPAMPLGPVAS